MKGPFRRFRAALRSLPEAWRRARFSRLPHFYWLFLFSILAPGLLLTYLSLRTIKDERILIEQSLESRNLEFLEALSRLLARTREDYLRRLQDQLQRTSSSPSLDNYLFLTSELLENPLLQSLAVFHGGSMVFPRPLETADSLGAFPTDALPQDLLEPGQRRLLLAVQEDFRAGRFPACLRSLADLGGSFPEWELEGPSYRAPASAFPSGAGMGPSPSLSPAPSPPSSSSPGLSSEALRPVRMRLLFGLRLLEIKAHAGQGTWSEAVAKGRTLIEAILNGEGFESYHQARFYLSEVVSTLASLEALPREERDYLWGIHQRSETFLVNAEYVQREWTAAPDLLLRYFGEDFQHPIRTPYFEGQPYLVIGYPWMDKETRVIARLNESVFTEAVRNELAQAKKNAWRGTDFALYNQRDQLLLSTDSIALLAPRGISQERQLGLGLPQWKVVIYRAGEGEIEAVGRRKLTLLYFLLGLSLTALLGGSLAVMNNLRKEKLMVRMKSNFLSAVSHELKTPLTSIRMFAEILESGRQTQEEKRRRYAHLIGEESMRLHGMIEGILNFTRLEDRKGDWNLLPLDLAALLREVAAFLAPAFEKAGIVLEVKGPPKAEVRGDKEALRSVLLNLLENALKYSHAGTRVEAQIEEGGEGTTLRIKDQGIGISAADQKHIFDKFYRAGDEMTRKAKGSGLGLAIVKQIMDYHKAPIKVQSKVGEGTEMILLFPRGKKRAAAEA